MTTVGSTAAAVNVGSGGSASIAEVVAWTRTQGEKGDLAPPTTAARVSALNVMAEMIASDEASDAASMLNNMAKLEDRYARKNPGKASNTGTTYGGRAKIAILEYLRWAEDPAHYAPPKGRGPREKKSPTPAPIVVPTPVVAKVEVPPPVNNQASSDVQTVRLGKGREPFRYSMPEEGFTLADALRVAYQLALNSDDYDPRLTPREALSAAMQRVE